MKIDLEKPSNTFPDLNISVGQFIKLIFQVKEKTVILEAGVSSKRTDVDGECAYYLSDSRYGRMVREITTPTDGPKEVRWIIYFRGVRIFVKDIQVLNYVYEAEERILPKEDDLLKEKIHLGQVVANFEFDPQKGFYDLVKQFEIELIHTALIACAGHQTRAAHLLGLNPTTLNSKIKGFGIDYTSLVDIHSSKDVVEADEVI